MKWSTRLAGLLASRNHHLCERCEDIWIPNSTESKYCQGCNHYFKYANLWMQVGRTGDLRPILNDILKKGQ